MANNTVSVFNDHVNDTLISSSIELKLAVEKYIIIMKFNVPEDDIDREYRREFLKTTIDVEKAMDGKFGGFLVKTLMVNLLRSLDFKPKFPIPAVVETNGKFFIV